MKGFNFKSSDVTNPAWRAAIGLPEPKKTRAKRYTGDHSQRKAWVRDMGGLPGRFFPTGRIPNYMNCRMNHYAKATLAAQQHRIGFAEAKLCYGILPPEPPLVVTLTRYGPRVLDDDGLAASLKHFRDGVAEALEIDDGDTDRLRFRNEQQVAKWYGLRIQIEAAAV